MQNAHQMKGSRGSAARWWHADGVRAPSACGLASHEPVARQQNEEGQRAAQHWVNIGPHAEAAFGFGWPVCTFPSSSVPISTARAYRIEQIVRVVIVLYWSQIGKLCCCRTKNNTNKMNCTAITRKSRVNLYTATKQEQMCKRPSVMQRQG